MASMVAAGKAHWMPLGRSLVLERRAGSAGLPLPGVQGPGYAWRGWGGKQVGAVHGAH